MADIAMLVAEEYERRVKSSRKGGEADTSDHLASCVSVLAQTLHKKIGQEKMEYLFKPRSQIGVEASNGFFSA